jgi:hypothetical protein
VTACIAQLTVPLAHSALDSDAVLGALVASPPPQLERFHLRLLLEEGCLRLGADPAAVDAVLAALSDGSGFGFLPGSGVQRALGEALPHCSIHIELVDALGEACSERRHAPWALASLPTLESLLLVGGCPEPHDVRALGALGPNLTSLVWAAPFERRVVPEDLEEALLERRTLEMCEGNLPSLQLLALELRRYGPGPCGWGGPAVLAFDTWVASRLAAVAPALRELRLEGVVCDGVLGSVVRESVPPHLTRLVVNSKELLPQKPPVQSSPQAACKPSLP